MPGDRPRPSPRPGSRPPAPCPRCGSTDTVRIAYGYPGPEMIEAAERGEVFLGGCCIMGNDPTRHCRACEHDFTPPRRKARRNADDGPWTVE
jgi:hypothetical protein